MSQAVPSTLAGYLHGGGYMNFSGLLLSRAFLMWLRPTPLAPGERERWTLELGSEQPVGRCWGPSTALGLMKGAELGQGPAKDALSGLVYGVIQPWKRLSMSSGCSPPAPAGDMTAACRAASLARLGGLPMPVESTTKCSVPTAWECLLWCNCTHQSCFE